MAADLVTWAELLQWLRGRATAVPKRQLARTIGISRQTLDSWLNAPEPQPTEASMRKLARAYGTDVADPLHVRRVRVARVPEVPDPIWRHLRRAMALWQQRMAAHIGGVLNAADADELALHRAGAEQALATLCELALQRLALQPTDVDTNTEGGQHGR